MTAPGASDEAFARLARQLLMATEGQVAQACRLQADAALKGETLALGEALVRQGAITPAQREAIEARLETQRQQGNRIGPYRLLKKIGEGGQGAVYLAEDSSGNRKVALKILPQGHASGEDFLRRFKREAEAAMALNHVNIARAFDAGEDRGYPYYAMEYCEGETLDARLKREKSLPIAEALALVMQVARGLKYAHDLRLIHRDIKPANVIVTLDGVAKILDLGLSKNLADPSQSFRTQTGIAIGTPHYIAPEQAKGEKDIDGRADLYSLGATLYHLVTGDTPFHGSSTYEIITRHLSEQLPDPRDLREDIPDGVVHVIRRLMAKKPKDRYPGCEELLADLEHVIDGKKPVTEELDAALSSVAVPKIVRRGRSTRRVPLADPLPRKMDRRTLALMGGAAAILLALVVTVVLLTRPKRVVEAPPETPEAAAPKPRPILPTPDLPPLSEPKPASAAERPIKPPVPAAAIPPPPPPAPPPPEPAAAPALNEEAWKDAVDLLPLIDPIQDAVAGTWTLKDGVLASDGTGRARLEIPYEPPEEYDFRITFTRGSGSNSVIQHLTRSGQSFLWVLGGWKNTVHAISQVDGKAADSNVTTVRAALMNGRRYVSTVQARRDGVKAWLDGQLLTQWKPEQGSLSLDKQWALRAAGVLGLMTQESPTEFHRVQVLEVSGPGRVTRAPAPPPAAGPGLVGHWKFDEGSGTAARDSSGRGHTATLVNSPAWTAGRVGGALKFDGKSAHVTVSDAPDLTIPGDLTIALWVRRDAASSVDTRLFGKGDGKAKNYILSLSGAPAGNFFLHQWDASGQRMLVLQSRTKCELGGWYHVAVVVAGSRGVLYVNGEPDAEGTRAGPPGLTRVPVSFGGMPGFPYFTGALDDVRLYDRALTEAEVRALYRGLEGPVVRLPVPDAARQREAEKLLKESVKVDARAGAAERSAVARKLLSQAKGGADPGELYVLLREARDQAAQAGDLETAMAAVHELAAGFEVEESAELAVLLPRLEGGARTAEAIFGLSDAYAATIEGAIREERFDEAQRLNARAASFGKAKEPWIAIRAAEWEDRLKEMKKEAPAYSAAQKALAENPDDAAACSVAGRFLCLYKGEWERGLPLLARGADVALRALAAKEQFGPAAAADRAAVGDGWWDAAQKASGPIKARFLDRAACWYRRALAGADPATQKRMGARLATVPSATIVDLLPLVDVQKDSVGGKWVFKDGALISDKASFARIEIPYQPPDEYDFRIQFVRTDVPQVKGGDVVQFLSRAGKAFGWDMGAYDNTLFILGMAGGASDQQLPNVKVASGVAGGQMQVSLVQVRRDAVRAYFNGKLIVQRKSDDRDLALQPSWKLRNESILGLGSWGVPVTFYRAELLEVAGRGHPSR